MLISNTLQPKENPIETPEKNEAEKSIKKKEERKVFILFPLIIALL